MVSIIFTRYNDAYVKITRLRHCNRPLDGSRIHYDKTASRYFHQICYALGGIGDCHREGNGSGVQQGCIHDVEFRGIFHHQCDWFMWLYPDGLPASGQSPHPFPIIFPTALRVLVPECNLFPTRVNTA
ncbi:hypothetical protein BLJ79_08430 [Arthrobacter sp. UCD-GKA]|nr:hypothetical protein BLJ79_08430 [Arthrobacter sp. UCD-GKA]